LAALMAGTLCLLAANLFDLGLSLVSVVPGPLFVITGLLLASRVRPATDAPARPWGALARSAALAVVVVPLSLQPLRALARLQQGEIYTWEAERADDDPALRERARSTLTRALELDPAVPRAADLLARWYEGQPDGLQPAIDILQARLSLAPHDEDILSAIAHIELRAGALEAGRTHPAAALQGPEGSPNQVQDRPALVRAPAG